MRIVKIAKQISMDKMLNVSYCANKRPIVNAAKLIDLNRIIDLLRERGVIIEFMKEHITTDDTSPMAEFFLNVLGSFAQMERKLIRERQAEGIAKAKARGAYRGRTNCLNEEQIKELKEKLATGITKSRVARDLKVTRQTVYKYMKL